MAIYEIKDEKEKLILVGVASSANDDTEQSLDELCDLVDTAGGVVVGRVIQRREMIHPATYVGKGKIEEIKELLWETDADGIVCDDELSPAQTANLTELLDTKVMDRTLIILDIFAGRASTSEGKIQVELAQLRYRQTQLTGAGKALSRLGGGIGTRGPGEKKLEMDRRLIKNRIALLNRELKDVKRHRDLTREQRSRNHMQVAAIVGYTNAGKSTLLNTLTDAKVLEEDQLFATLDPTTRNLKLPSGQEMLVTDTVGFIRKLPHHLIEAFRSTLEEAKYADLILHVVDSSNPQMDEQMYVVYETLRKLEVMNKPVITVFNKMDRRGENALLRDFQADRTVQISAKTGEGIPELLCAIEQQLREQKILIERMYPYQESSRVQMIRKYGELLEEHYTEEGIYIGFDIFDNDISCKTVNDFWLGDCVELLASDITNKPNADLMVYKEEGGVLQAAFAPTWSSTGYGTIASVRTNTEIYNNRTQMQAMLVTNATGYSGEILLPFTMVPQFKTSIEAGKRIDMAIVCADAERSSRKRIQASNVPHNVENNKTMTARMPQYLFD